MTRDKAERIEFHRHKRSRPIPGGRTVPRSRYPDRVIVHRGKALRKP
jgi:hypothetical protein